MFYSIRDHWRLIWLLSLTVSYSFNREPIPGTTSLSFSSYGSPAFNKLALTAIIDAYNWTRTAVMHDEVHGLPTVLKAVVDNYCAFAIWDMAGHTRQLQQEQFWFDSSKPETIRRELLRASQFSRGKTVVRVCACSPLKRFWRANSAALRQEPNRRKIGSNSAK